MPHLSTIKKTGAYGGNVQIAIGGYNKNSLILVHNHPNSAAFSFEDFVTLNNNPEIKTMIAAGHNGKVYKMSVGNGKRLDLSDEKMYTILENEWQRVFRKTNGALGAILKFTKELGWEFE